MEAVSSQDSLQTLSSALSDAGTAPVHPPVSVISQILSLLSCEQFEGMSIFVFACYVSSVVGSEGTQ